MDGLLSIDPGKNTIAWAWFADRVLCKCGLVLDTDIRLLHEEIPEVVWRSLKTIVCEKMRVYPRQLHGQDPNDLIDVSITGAFVAGCIYILAINAPETQVKFVTAREWKGSRPKQIDNRITKALLSPEELSVFINCGVQESLRHNVIDAIGIGLHELGRR